MIIRNSRAVGDPDVVVNDAPAATVVEGGGYSVADRLSSLVYTLASIVGFIILVRFVLLLVGANQNNDFAAFMMKISQPLVQPFLSLFGYSPSVGQGVVEWTDLVAMAVYWIAAAIVSKLIYALLAPRYERVVYH